MVIQFNFVHVTEPDNLVAVSVSVILTKWRTRLRRKMNDRDIVRLERLCNKNR